MGMACDHERDTRLSVSLISVASPFRFSRRTDRAPNSKGREGTRKRRIQQRGKKLRARGVLGLRKKKNIYIYININI